MNRLMICAAFGASVIALMQSPGWVGNLNTNLGQLQNKQASNLPTLADTEIWIDNTFNDENVGQDICHEFEGINEPAGFHGGATSFSCLHQRFVARVHGCQATVLTFHTSERFVYDASFAAGHDSVSEKVEHKDQNTIVKFSLGDIDPGSLELSETYGSFGPAGTKTWHPNRLQNDVSLATTDSRDSITIVHPESAAPNESYKHHAANGLITVHSDYAARFVKALTHAVELCGGKPSTF